MESSDGAASITPSSASSSGENVLAQQHSRTRGRSSSASISWNRLAQAGAVWSASRRCFDNASNGSNPIVPSSRAIAQRRKRRIRMAFLNDLSASPIPYSRFDSRRPSSHISYLQLQLTRISEAKLPRMGRARIEGTDDYGVEEQGTATRLLLSQRETPQSVSVVIRE